MELIKKLNIIEYLYSSDYNIYKTLIRLCSDEVLKWDDLQYLNYKYKYDHYDIHKDIKKNSTWITFDDKVHVQLFLTENKVEIVCRESSDFGNYISSRWKGSITLPDEYINLFENEINRKFNYHLEDLYEKELEVKKQKRLKEISNKLLK